MLLSITIRIFCYFCIELMRKTAAILLLMLIAFNTIGYKLWFNYAMQQADFSLEASLNKNNFNQQDLFTLKIPLHLPYQNTTSSFERVDGEITVNGKNYKFVQRMVQNDTLYLQCISHAEKNTLEKKSNDYFGTVNDLIGNGDANKMPGKNSSLLKFNSADFIINEVYGCKYSNYSFVCNLYSLNTFTYSSSTHLQKLIKPPQSV